MKKGSNRLANLTQLHMLASGVVAAYNIAKREVPSTAPAKGRATKPSRTGEART